MASRVPIPCRTGSVPGGISLSYPDGTGREAWWMWVMYFFPGPFLLTQKFPVPGMFSGNFFQAIEVWGWFRI